MAGVERNATGARRTGCERADGDGSARRRVEHLIIQTAFLGDLLLGIPLFKELRRLRPGDRLTVFCRKGLGDFLLKSELVDDVVEADKSSRESWSAAVRELKSRHFDLLICPHESPRSVLLAARLKAVRKIGYRSPFDFLVFGERVKRPMHLPEALRQLALLQPLDEQWEPRLAGYARLQTHAGGQFDLFKSEYGSESGLVPVPEWAEMSVPRLSRLRADFRKNLLIQSPLLSERAGALIARIGLGVASAAGKLACLAPGSVWPTKMWSAEGFTRVARELLFSGYRVVLMGAPDERGICEEIASRAPGAISIAGETSLFESAEILALADLLVCNDSGAMHMAAAAGVPTVAIFGPTVLDFGYRPWQDRARVVQAEVSCRPCGKHGAKSCPLGTHECMKKVSAESVLEAVRHLSQ